MPSASLALHQLLALQELIKLKDLIDLLLLIQSYAHLQPGVVILLATINKKMFANFVWKDVQDALLTTMFVHHVEPVGTSIELDYNA